MPLDTADTRDVSETSDHGQESGAARAVGAKGMRAMQGDSSLGALQARIDSLQAETQAKEAAQWAELNKQKAETAPPADAQPEVPPASDTPPPHATTDGSEIAEADRIESGAEKPEKEMYTHGRGPEG